MTNEYRSVNRRIAALAFPAIISNITVPLLGLSDTAITGHLGDASFIAAIAAGGMMLNVVYWLFGFLRMGTTGLTADAYGAGADGQISAVLSRSVAIALTVGVAIVLLQGPLLGLLSGVIGAEPEVERLAGEYYRICIWGTPALLMTMSINGWFIGMQNTVWPMAVSISVNVLNVAASLSAVFLLGLGFKGVAYGTLAANWAGLLLALVALGRFAKGRRLWCGWKALWKGGELRRFFGVNTDLFFRSACIMGVSLAVTAYGARLGDLTLAVNAVMMQFFILFSYFMDGLAYSGEALCGRSAGARDREGLMRSVGALTLWGAVAAVVFGLIYLLFLPQAVGLLTDVSEVRAGVVAMRFYVVAIPVLSAAAFLYDGFFIGLTAIRRMLVTTFLSAIFFFAIVWLGPKANATLWTAFLGYLLLRGVGLAAQLKHALRAV